MRRRIVISAVLIVPILAVVGGIGHYQFGWWQTPHEAVTQSVGGYGSESEPATLQEVLATAHEALDKFGRDIKDYSGVIVKTERIGTKPVTTVMFAKIREEPFSVYLYFLDRSDNTTVKRREVLYVKGQNDGKLLVHNPGLFGNIIPPMAPDNPLAMLGEHYPITEIGLANLCRQLIKRGEAAGDPGQVEVKRFPRARINDRACNLIQVIYPVHEKTIWGYLARVFVDNERNFPIRVELFELPEDRKKEPQLVEEYTYLDLKLNNGYTNADFDRKNRQYKFP
jgi:hypothetical protein